MPTLPYVQQVDLNNINFLLFMYCTKNLVMSEGGGSCWVKKLPKVVPHSANKGRQRKSKSDKKMEQIDR